jgi:hypothetical protein
MVADYLVLIHRNITPNLLEALSDTPVVMVTAPGRAVRVRWCNPPSWKGVNT